MSHYYVNDPKLKSRLKKVYYDFQGVKLEFETDLGVFSKDRVDFGTNILINALREKDIKAKKILDLGCGYGIIGLSLAKRFDDSFVTLVDVNERALDLTKRNKDLNKISNVEIKQSYIYESIDSKFDLIVTNPPIRAGKEVVHNIVLGSVNYLNENGAIYLVIKKKQGAPSLIAQMEKIFDVEIILKKNGYYVIKGVKKI